MRIYAFLHKNFVRIQIRVLIIDFGFLWVLMRNIEDGMIETFTLNPVFCEKI